MRGTAVLAAICMTAGLLSGCGGGDRDGPAFSLDPRALPPDEFMVVPQNPLQMPSDLTNLPEPGGVNRADIDVSRQISAALGGN